jgi:hypothetical protein
LPIVTVAITSFSPGMAGLAAGGPPAGADAGAVGACARATPNVVTPVAISDKIAVRKVLGIEAISPLV